MPLGYVLDSLIDLVKDAAQLIIGDNRVATTSLVQCLLPLWHTRRVNRHVLLGSSLALSNSLGLTLSLEFVHPRNRNTDRRSLVVVLDSLLWLCFKRSSFCWGGGGWGRRRHIVNNLRRVQRNLPVPGFPDWSS